MPEKISDPIVFFGTPAFAVPTLQAIVASGRKVALVVTRPDAKAGRGNKSQASPVKKAALALNIEVHQPHKIRTRAFRDKLVSTGAKTFVVVAFGRIFTQKHLDLPKHFLNVHASLLPRWRGASPIESSVLAGDTQTGVSIMQLALQLDAGDVYQQKKMAIPQDMNAGDLRTCLASLGADALLEVLDALDKGQASSSPQASEGVTFCAPIKVGEAQVDWDQTPSNLRNHVRAYCPKPGAYSFMGGKRIKILQVAVTAPPEHLLTRAYQAGEVLKAKKGIWVACQGGFVELLEVQKEGKSIQAGAVFVQGCRHDRFETSSA